MTHPINLSRYLLVRLNAESFPVTDFERAAWQAYDARPNCIEASGMDIAAQAGDCDALFVVAESLPAGVIERLARCRVISRMGAGTDKIDVEAATRRGIVVANVPDFCVAEQADHTMALLLALARKLPQMDRALREGNWLSGRQACRSIRRFSGRTLGLIGFGRSARAVARRAAPFGFRILATRRRADASDAEAQALGVERVNLESVVRQADYLSLHLPLNDETRHLLNRERIASMKPGAYVINTSRGALIDETALAEALRSGRLAGAGLDTFHEINVHGPQHPPQHPLLELDQVICTPHVAAFSTEAAQDVANGAIENVAAVLSGKWPLPERIVNAGVAPRVALGWGH
jgi:D-3-phosphoglycerate dehydrogenase